MIEGIKKKAMTYKLSPFLSKIESAVVIILPDNQQMYCANGTEATEAEFEQSYLVDSMKDSDGVIEIKLMENPAPSISWIGEEQTFF